jgi:hypothetical protein
LPSRTPTSREKKRRRNEKRRKETKSEKEEKQEKEKDAKEKKKRKAQKERRKARTSTPDLLLLPFLFHCSFLFRHPTLKKNFFVLFCYFAIPRKMKIKRMPSQTLQKTTERKKKNKKEKKREKQKRRKQKSKSFFFFRLPKPKKKEQNKEKKKRKPFIATHQKRHPPKCQIPTRKVSLFFPPIRFLFFAIPNRKKKPIRFSPPPPPLFSLPPFFSSAPFPAILAKSHPDQEKIKNKKPSRQQRQKQKAFPSPPSQKRKQQKRKTKNQKPEMIFHSFRLPHHGFFLFLFHASPFFPPFLGSRAPFVPFSHSFLFFSHAIPRAKLEKDEKKCHRNQKTTKNSPPYPGKSHPDQKKATRSQVFATQPTFFKLHLPFLMGQTSKSLCLSPSLAMQTIILVLWTLWGQGVVSPRG